MYGKVIVHHGIKGMMWGVRRTPAELERAANSVREGGNKANNSIAGVRKKSKTSKIREQARKMSDEELRKKTNRMNLERNYAKAVAEDSGRGHQKVKNVIEIVTGVAAAGASAIVVADYIKKVKDAAG